MADIDDNGGEIVAETNTETGKTRYSKIRRARINTPRLDIEVTQDIIDKAVRADSRTCMVAEAIKAKHDWATKVHVDWAEIRVTDAEKNLRYVYRTPRVVGAAILAFDQGMEVEPFHAKTVQASHVVRHPSMKKAKGGKATAPNGDREAKRLADRERRDRINEARGEVDEHGQLQPNPEYLAELAQRLEAPTADLGPAIPMMDYSSSNDAVPVMVGGSTRPTSARLVGRGLRPGQMKVTRKFGAREFWKGDGSGVEGVVRDREEGRAFRRGDDSRDEG